jgi:carbonic anhydrase
VPRSAPNALNKLLEGNRRFVDGTRVHDEFREDHRNLTSPQDPVAAVLTCADARVPPLELFDLTIGDLFEVRNAGHLARGPSVGSLEFAVIHLGVRLVLVLAHDDCGAVKAAQAVKAGEAEPQTPAIGCIMESIVPLLEGPGDTDPSLAAETLALAQLERIREVSEPIRKAEETGDVWLLAAMVEHHGGHVRLLTRPPRDPSPRTP